MKISLSQQYFFVVALCIALLFSSLSAEKLYVFYPTTIRPSVLQKKLKEACPAIDITVFGRYKDFIAQINIAPPDAIIVKPDLLKQLPDYEKNLSGVKQGKADEPYFLLSIDKNIDLSKIGQEVIGIVDFLGRKETAKLVASFFTPSPKIKRVIKIEDLLPLLIFNMATSLFLCEDDIAYLKETSKLNFMVTNLPNVKIGLISLAIRKKSSSELIVKSIKGLSNELNLIFTIDEWN